MGLAKPLWFVVALAGCDVYFDDPDGPIERVTSAGRLCLYASPPSPTAPPEQAFVAGQPVYAEYQVATCLSSSCTRDELATLSLRRISATEFEVEALARWLDLSGPGRACTADCLMLGDVAETAALAAGSYDFVFAPAALQLVIPSDHVQPPCVETN